jgi:CRP-like cAMP-binding protein
MIAPDRLRQFPCFDAIGDETLHAVAAICEQRACAPGEELCSQGGRAEKLYILMSGQVDLEVAAAGGTRRILGSLGAGDVLCWSAIVEPHELTASCLARTPCEVLEIDGPMLRHLCAQDCLLGYRMMHQVARELSRRLRHWPSGASDTRREGTGA